MSKRIASLIGVVGMMVAVGCGGNGGGGAGGHTTSDDDGSSGDGSGNGNATGAGQTSGGNTTTGGSSFDCCLDGAHFKCPSQSALEACSNFQSPDPSSCMAIASPCGNTTSSGPSTTSGGPSTTSGGPSTTSGGPSGDFGKQCAQNADCMFDSCLIAEGADFGYCTNTCMDFTDCPTFWSCDQVANASGKYCIQD